LEDNPRFRTFVVTHQDKVRKKLSVDDEDARLDVRAELLVAERLLADRRFEVAFEAYGARQLGPDLSAAYRTNERFNLEVTRTRTTEGLERVKLANVIAAKLRQMPAEVANALVIVGHELELTEESVAEATHLLRSRMEGDVAARYPRLSGVLVLDEATEPVLQTFWINRDARHPLSAAVVAATTGCFAR
jgi:hypothetical protein